MDIELSFTDAASIMSLVEDLLKTSWPEDMKTLVTPFTKISYHDAMHWYGTDKPDLSFDNKVRIWLPYTFTNELLLQQEKILCLQVSL